MLFNAMRFRFLNGIKRPNILLYLMLNTNSKQFLWVYFCLSCTELFSWFSVKIYLVWQSFTYKQASKGSRILFKSKWVSWGTGSQFIISWYLINMDNKMCSRSAVLDYKGICAQDGYQMLVDLFVGKVTKKTKT